MDTFARALVLLVLLGILAIPAAAQTLEVTGYAGDLGEWELIATVTETISSRAKEYFGPLTMTHVGVCTKDGPEQKTGEMRYQISGSPSLMKATLLVDGVACSYSGRLSDAYTGTMSCPGRRAVPLSLWVR